MNGGRRRAGWLFWLVILAVHGGIALLESGHPPRRPLGDEALYRAAAIELLETGTTDLSPLWPPLYIWYLAALNLLGQGSWWLLPWVQVGLLVLAAWLLRRLSRRLLGQVPEADLAPFLLLVYPPLVAFSHYFWPEVLHLVLMLGLVEGLLQPHRDGGRMWAWGALLGLAVASKALLTPWVLLLLLWVGFGRWLPSVAELSALRSGWRRLSWRGIAWRPMLWASLGLAAIVLPLMAWNAQRIGMPILSDSVPFNIWVGLQDRSQKSFVDGVAGEEYRTFLASGSDFAERREVLWEKIEGKVRDHSVLDLVWAQLSRQYFRLFDKDSYFTDQLPGGVIAARGRGYQGAPPWLTWLARHASYAVYLGILLLGCLGVVVSSPSRRPWLWGVLAFLVYNLTLFLVLHVKSRYRIQLMPWWILFATCGFSWLLRCGVLGQESERTIPQLFCAADGSVRRISGSRWTLCVLAMLMLLYLACSR